MSDKIIHQINISYDDSSDRVKDFVDYLERSKMKDEMQSYYQKAAKKDSDHKIHINDKKGNEFTLICYGDHKCVLRLRGTSFNG